jgi:peptidylprolyl isomerase
VATSRALVVLALLGAATAPGCAKSSDSAARTCVIGPDLTALVLADGSGSPPASGESVLVHYVGTLADGTKFDSSRDREQPLLVTAGAGQVIPAWDQALLRMKCGDHWKITIPSALAFGDAGRPPSIPPKADLTLDMERLPLPDFKTEVLAQGKGAQCVNGQTVSVHYVGTLEDGKQFDSSRDRGRPFEFALGSHQVISGWEIAVGKMRVGDREKVVIPWAFAYGARGQPPTIPPKADLVFDIEVLDAK